MMFPFPRASSTFCLQARLGPKSYLLLLSARAFYDLRRICCFVERLYGLAHALVGVLQTLNSEPAVAGMN